MELLKLSFISGDNAKWFRCFGKKKCGISYKNISYDPEISLIVTYLSEILKNVFKHKPVHECFIAVLLLLPITGNKSKFPQLG